MSPSLRRLRSLGVTLSLSCGPQLARAAPVDAPPAAPAPFTSEWEVAPRAMIALRAQDEVRGGALVERGFRLQATRLILHATHPRWHVQLHYQLHSDEGRIATGNMYVQWEASRWFAVLVGQNRVPFNREHITGWFYHQLVDRSLVNARFGLQRDLGAAAYFTSLDRRWDATLGVWNGARLAAANDDRSFLTTARVAWSPQGPVAFQEGDLAWTRRPLVSIAFAAAYNPSRTFVAEGAKAGETTRWQDVRQAVFEQTLRYAGVSLSTEQHARTRLLSKGRSVDFGSLAQLGIFVVPRRLEVLARAAVAAGSKIGATEAVREHAAGLSLYVDGHNLKVQADAALLRLEDGTAGRRVRLQTSAVF